VDCGDIERSSLMGAVDFSISVNLVMELRGALGLTAFVETGTYLGDSTESVLPLFDEIHTIELSPELVARAAQRFAHDPNVHLHRGHSPCVLRDLQPQLKGKGVLFWLDAHWCVADHASGVDSRCPLLEELDALGALNDHCVVLIDDARLFLCPPPAPQAHWQWPRFQDVLKGLRALSDAHELMVVNDVIAFYPRVAREPMEAFARRNGIDWLAVLRRVDSLEAHVAELTRILDERLALINELHGMLNAARDEADTSAPAGEHRSDERIDDRSQARSTE
jgi:hypothetical protein